MITAQFGVQADHDPVVRDENTDATDGETDVAVTKLNFTAKTDVATVIVGKQGQPTPFLDDERGDGVVALVPAGPVTLAAGHFTGMVGGQDLAAGGGDNSSELDQRDIVALAVIGSFGPVNAQAWYLDASEASASSATADLESGVTGYSVNVAAEIEGIKAELNHASLGIQNQGATNWQDETLTRLTVSAAVEGINLVAGYGMTNDTDNAGHTNAGRVHGVDLTSDNDAKTNMAMDQLNLDALNDADAFLVGASTTMGEYTMGVAYLNGESKNGAVKTDFDELDVTVAYAMSKNFTIKGIYAMDEVKTPSTKTENDTLTLRATYKF
jgi:hypothetical protein